MDEKFFGIINNKVFKVLESQGFQRNKVENTDDNEMAALYTGEGVAYIVVYYNDKKQVLLRSSSMTDDGPDNQWKTMATWMFDPENDGEKQAESIGNDFAETLGAPVRVKAVKSAKKKKNSDEGKNDPVFLSKRLMNIFPELRDEIKAEEEGYDPFRGVTFTKEHVVPKVNELLRYGSNKEIDKLAAILNAQYNAGDLDTRSIITIVILNGIDSQQSAEKLNGCLDDTLKKSWQFAKKYKGKKVKPEKPKAKKKTIAERLGEQ